LPMTAVCPTLSSMVFGSARKCPVVSLIAPPPPLIDANPSCFGPNWVFRPATHPVRQLCFHGLATHYPRLHPRTLRPLWRPLCSRNAHGASARTRARLRTSKVRSHVSVPFQQSPQEFRRTPHSSAIRRTPHRPSRRPAHLPQTRRPAPHRR